MKQNRVHRSFLIPALLLLFLAAGPACGEEKATDTYHREFDAKKITLLSVETVNGSIDMRGRDDNSILVDAEISVRGKDAGVCEKLLKDVEIRIDEDDDELDIETKIPKKSDYHVQVDFTIKLPHRMGVETETVNGAVYVVDIIGGAELETTNGAVHCERVRGGVEAETINGGIDLNGVGGEVEAGTINGSIVCVIDRDPPANLDLDAVNGAVSLSLSGKIDAVIDASTVNGKISVSGTSVGKFDRFHRNYEASFGSGTGKYELSTVNGGVTIEFKTPD